MNISHIPEVSEKQRKAAEYSLTEELEVAKMVQSRWLQQNDSSYMNITERQWKPFNDHFKKWAYQIVSSFAIVFRDLR